MLSILLCNEYCVSESKTNFTVSESLLLAPPIDCQRAIDIFVRQGWLGRHPEIFEQVLGICEQLNDIDNSRVSTSIFTSGRLHQYLWSNNCISHSSLCSYIARRTLFIIARY